MCTFVNAVAPAAVALAGLLTSAANAQLRVANYNVAAAKGDPIAMKAVFAAIAADDKFGFAVAPHVVVVQEAPSSKIDEIESLLDSAIAGFNYTRATYTTSPSEDGSGGAEAMFYRSDVVAEIVAGHVDLDTGAGRKTDRWQLQLVGYSSASAKFYVYGMHLKASQGAANEAIRLAGAQTIRANADGLGQGIHIIYSGDFNLYSNNESAYAAFLAAGNGQAFDPLGTGSWSGAANAIKHSQSPRDIVAGGLVGGGMDDRFDFQLSTSEFQDGNGLSIIAGTYRSLGNDGNHFDIGINVGNNTYYPNDIPRSNTLADNLFDASDHIAVVCDYQLPAVMSASLTGSFGKVIKNAVYSLNVSIQNIAAGVPVGIDALDYEVQGNGVLSGNFAGTAPLAPSSAIVQVPVNTSTVGFVSGSALVTAVSEATQGASQLLPTSGQVVRAANGSFSAIADTNAAVAASAMTEGDAGLTIPASVFNYLYDSNQALLDIDLVAGLGSRFSLFSGIQSGVGANPAVLTFAFDGAGATAGMYSQNVTVSASDQDIPGAMSSLLQLTLTVTVNAVGNPADLDGNGTVDGADLAILLGQWGADGSADITGDGVVDGADLATLLGAWM
ncbi:MAG: hypothetical protein SGJ09_13835 [Phycisphaerae bacterium]|nr:hypothetical protein [Phycisphaerae bacterium]